MTLRDNERRLAEDVLGPVILPPQAMRQGEVDELTNLVNELCDTTFLRNSADGKEVILSEENRRDLQLLLRELKNERQARQEAYELAGSRASEILALRARVKRLEDAIRKAVSHAASDHSNWDGEGNSYIDAIGHKLLKDTLEAK